MTDFCQTVSMSFNSPLRCTPLYYPACGGNPEILEKIDFSRISRFREAGDIQPLFSACLF